jgi:voltage-gated potassium channel
MRRWRKKLFEKWNFSFFIIFGGIWASALLGALLVWIIEPETFTHFSKAVWWAIVTMTTVGYGDIVPQNGLTHGVAVAVMFAGIAFISIFTATISSVYVGRQIREGKGLEKITWHQHIIICGWNENTSNLLDNLDQLVNDNNNIKVVLVNNLPEEEITAILYKDHQFDLRFVRGDFTRESALERANVTKSRAVIIVPNEIDHGDPDEKTILATLTIKGLNAQTPVTAFLNRTENRPHLRRANADEIYVRDEFSAYLLASHVLNPGIPQAYYSLMDSQIAPNVIRFPVPRDYVGRTFAQLSDHLRDKHNMILLGFVKEIKQIAFSDFLSADSSALDAFIERKLRQAGHSLRDKERLDVKLNPGNHYQVQEGDIRLVIQ